MSNRKLEFSRGDVIAKKYEVSDLLDESPLGLTYRVKHIKSGKYVRLTVLRPKVAGLEHKDQVLACFRRAKELAHPNLLKVGELDEHDGLAYYTMEDFEGQTLREVITEYKINSKQFQAKEAAQVTLQILEGLQASHEAGIFLRALRPEYVLVKVRYTGPRKDTLVANVKLVGVGFWDLVDTGVLAEDEFTRGEAQYMAPELKSFEPTPTEKVDLYSAGVILYEMLTGTAPVGTFQLPTTVRPDLPKTLNNIVELALGNSPDDRYPHAQDFISGLQRLFEGTAVAEDEEVVTKPLITPVGWVLGVVLVGAVGALLFGLGVNPDKAALAKDSQLRKEVKEATLSPDPGAVKALLAQHPPNMVLVPEGPFVHGRMHKDPEAYPTEALAEKIPLHAFLIDAFEYPNKKGAKVASEVGYDDAERMCAEQGKRLCTAEEWEKACKGPLSSIYSYGDFYDPEFCGEGLEKRGPTGARDECKSRWIPDGPYDMSGNFREWTATSPSGKENRRMVKGGFPGNPSKGTRCAFATDESTAVKDANLSFRCCRDASAPPIAVKGDAGTPGTDGAANGTPGETAPAPEAPPEAPPTP